MKAIDFLRQRAAALRPRLAALLRRPQRWRSLHGLAWLAAALALAGVLYLLALFILTPSISDIRKAKADQPAQLVSEDGRLLAEYKWVNREWVPLDRIAPAVVDALIATEDHRFYGHWGLDWRRTLAAVVRTAGGDRQGGSTISQQLARNLYPEEIGRAPTLSRKLKEAVTAFKIEWSYSKDEILETYLNTVPFLYNAYGIEMAARTYFDKSADKLNVLESATLIGMLKGTAYYNPVLNPERAQERRNTVLSQMKKRGKLDAQEYDTLVRRPLRIRFERQSEIAGLAPHLAQQLKRQLIEWADRRGYSLYADGLVIRTTIDGRLQELANQSVQQQGKALQQVADKAWAARGVWTAKNPLVQQLVRESTTFAKAVAGGEAEDAAASRLLEDAAFLRELRAAKTRVQVGFMALDPRSGAVRAWVGSRDYAQDPFDHVQAARRQPGSTFKPFVYGAAFAAGRSPQDTLLDTAVEIPLGGGQVWRPRDGNAPPSEEPMTLADGLAYSKNTITAQLMSQVGPQQVAQLARAMGVRESPLEAVPALALGTSAVTLKEMVAAYGTIAGAGRYRAPRVITRIEDASGRVLETFVPASPEQALGVTAAQQLRDALRGAVNHGTATAIRGRFGIRADVAGKTGTTQDNTDGWFILMHPQLVAGSWVGFNDGRITLRSNYWGQGAHSALPVVGSVFRQALRGKLIDAGERFVQEEDPSWSSRAAGAVGALRNWVYDLFGRPTGEQAGPAGAPAPAPEPPPAPASTPQPEPEPEERPEITEAPLVPLEQVAPRQSAPAVPDTAPVWVTGPEEAPLQAPAGEGDGELEPR
ncbi:transglycosylase domain-containing protein [Pulveribacter sp.]|uniref:penicillin-binding protein 1A n=1 Tax=Pulveribacter sp. TaxID=2678893 RepID=UPI0028AA5327|nr:transglycosylase domain-containing protein [Pulveribacter sp.]